MDVFHLRDLRSVLFTAALIQGYSRTTSFGQGLTVAWTLVIELTFYVALPIFAFVLWRARPRRRLRAEVFASCTLLVAGVACAAWASFGHPPIAFGPLSLPANLAPFALGMLLAVASAHIQTSGTVPRVLALMGRAPWVWWTVALVAWASTVKLVGIRVVYTRATLPGPGQMVAEQLLFAIAGAAAVVPAVLGDQHRGLSRRLLQLRPVVYLGAVSYGVYLWHETVLAELVNHLGVTARSGNFVVLTVLCVLGTVAIASFSYYALERPLIRFSHHPHRLHVLRRLARRRPPVAPSPPGSAAVGESSAVDGALPQVPAADAP